MNTVTRIKKELEKMEVEADKMVPFQKIHYKQAIEDIRTSLAKIGIL